MNAKNKTPIIVDFRSAKINFRKYNREPKIVYAIPRFGDKYFGWLFRLFNKAKKN